VNDEHGSVGSAGMADHGVTITHKFGDTAILRKILADTYDELSAYSYRDLLKCLERWTCPPSLHPSDR
jgi:hypothetical protein